MLEDICSSVWILVRPEPIISNPPVFLYCCKSGSVISIYLFSINPEGPPLKPYRTESGLAFFIASNNPEITLCPPAACPPDKITPIFLRLCFLFTISFDFSSLMKGCLAVFGKEFLTTASTIFEGAFLIEIWLKSSINMCGNLGL